LEYFNYATKQLQTNCATLSDCRAVVDALIDLVATKKELSSSPLHNCTFEPTRISLTGRHSPDSEFESGVIKIQRGESNTMTEGEKAACIALEKTDVALSDCETNSTNLIDELHSAIKLKKRKFDDFQGDYMDCSFLLGSAAEIERV